MSIEKQGRHYFAKPVQKIIAKMLKNVAKLIETNMVG